MRRVILAICATAAALVLLLSFKTHSQSGSSGTSPAAALGTPAPGTGASAGNAQPNGAAPSASSSPTASAGATKPAGTAKPSGAKTVTGAAWPTIYGPVQVRITVTNGKITAVSAMEYPQETRRDCQINSFAIPQLNSEVLAAGNANIDAVSGATYTSQGYLGSLQNALDKAHA